MNRKSSRKLFSMMLALLMVIGMFPINVLADFPDLSFTIEPGSTVSKAKLSIENTAYDAENNTLKITNDLAPSTYQVEKDMSSIGVAATNDNEFPAALRIGSYINLYEIDESCLLVNRGDLQINNDHLLQPTPGTTDITGGAGKVTVSSYQVVQDCKLYLVPESLYPTGGGTLGITNSNVKEITADGDILCDAGKYRLYTVYIGFYVGENHGSYHAGDEVEVTAGGTAANVCAIGSTEYATLDLALAAVPDSTPATIDILTDINHNSAIQLKKKNITLNLNGNTVNISTSVTAATALIVDGGCLNLELIDDGSLNISGKSHGVNVMNNGIATVTNSKVSNPALISGNAVAAYTGGTLVVLGDAVAEGADDTAVLASSGGNVIVNGNARAVKTAIYAGPVSGSWPKPTVHIKGSAIVTGTHADGAGAFAFGGGEITIDGEIKVVDQDRYIRLNNDYKKKGETSPTPIKAGYLTYSDGTGTYSNTVWIKQGASSATPLDKPTGLRWDISANQLKATWTAVSNANQYKVEWYKDDLKLGMETHVSSPGISTDDIKTNLLAYGTGIYTFTVQATAATGSGFLDSEISEPSDPYPNTPGGTTYIVKVNGSYASLTGEGSYPTGVAVTVHAGNRSNYSFTGWTSSDVTITNAGNKDASFTMPSKAVTVTANWSYSGGGGGGGYTAVNAQITPKEAVFDKGGDNTNNKDVSVTLKKGSYSLSGILLDGKALVKGTDFTVSGSIITFKKEYLAAFYEGKYKFTFDMSGGTDPVLTISITDKTDPDTGAHISFEDVKADDWFASNVMWAFETGLMQGVSEKPMLFSPHGAATRGMIVTIMYRLEGSPATDVTNTFSDVAAGKWYTAAVTWAAENKIVEGYGNGKFGPEDPIFREQMAAILYRYATSKSYDVSMRADLSKIIDAGAVSGWAKNAMSWANAEGLILGDRAKLTPTAYAERCQVAAILQRFVENILK